MNSEPWLNRVYSVLFEQLILPNTYWHCEFQLNNYHRQFKFKSLTWDYRIESHTTGILSTDIQQTQGVCCIIGNTVNKIHESFQNFTLPLSVLFDGTYVQIFKPTQLHFDSWFVNEVLPLRVEVMNNDVINSYNYRLSVIAEIEEY